MEIIRMKKHLDRVAGCAHRSVTLVDCVNPFAKAEKPEQLHKGS